MKKQLFISIFLITLLGSCYFRSYPPKPKITTKKIQLETDTILDKLFTYENKSSVTYLDIKDIVDLLENKLEDKNLCQQKILKYSDLAARLRNSDKNGYVIIPTMKPEDFQSMMGDLDTLKTGYAPLDFYSSRLTLDVSNSEWIPPYGYKPQYIDTLEALKYNDFYDWIVTELIIKGKAKVCKKGSNEFQKYVIYEIVNFRDSHGGENLLFEDKKIFMRVDVYSDMILPDFECMDSTKLKEWGL